MVNSPFLSWVYNITSIDAFGRLNGSVELVIAALLAVKPWFPKASVVGGIFAALFFVNTLGFMITTPGVGEASAGGFPVLSADGEFLMKDIANSRLSAVAAGGCSSRNTPKGDTCQTDEHASESPYSSKPLGKSCCGQLCFWHRGRSGYWLRRGSSRSFLVGSGFIVAVVVFAVTQAILSLSILKLPHRYASLLLGGTGLALTIVALILASVLTHGLTIDGMASWLATTVVVWLVTTIWAITLPELLIRDGAGST